MKKRIFISMVSFVLVMALILSCSVFSVEVSGNLRVASTKVEGQNIIVEFTENVSAVSFADTKVYRVNGRTQLTTSTPIVVGNKLKIPFTEALLPGNEYMIELPMDSVGASNNIYFMSEDAIVIGKTETFDDNYNSSTGITIADTTGVVAGSGSAVLETGGKDGSAGLVVKTPQTTADTSLTKAEYQVAVNNVNILQADTADVQVIEFDMKAPNDTNIPFVLQFYDSNGKFISFGRNLNGNILGFYHNSFSWFLSNDSSRIKSAALHIDGSPLSFADNEWKHIKLEWDIGEKTGKFYVNGQQAAPSYVSNFGDTNIETGATDFGSIASVKMYAFPTLKLAGTVIGTPETKSDVEMFVLDNFRTYGYKRDPGVSTVRFNTKDGDNLGPYSTLRSSLETIDISFNSAMNLADSPTSNIEIYFNNTIIPYTAVYDEGMKCYTVTPEVVDDETGDYRVEIIGLKTAAGEDIENYTCGANLNGKVITYFDGVAYNYPIIEIDGYPAMAIDDLAEMIGGRVENGNTLIRDDDPKTSWNDAISIKYYEGNQLAEDDRGRIVLERKPVVHQGRMYIPVSTLENTLGWTKYYNKFDKTLEISTGTNYPDTELVVYARDYGAVGDGVHNDLPAILEAIDVATSSGVPSKVELEPGKTYLLGSRNDAQAIFQLLNVKNFILDGKGSELLIERAANSFIEMRNCTNVKFINMEIDYKEMMFTQGRVTEVDSVGRKFTMVMDEGYPLPPVNRWVRNVFVDTATPHHLDRWAFGIIVDSVENRSKFGNYDHVFIEAVNKVPDTERTYEVSVHKDYRNHFADMEVGDRFVLNMGFRAYDVGYHGLEVANNTAGIVIKESGDVTLENIKYYQTQWQGCFLSENWGRVRFIGYKNITKPGRLLCCNSDGIYACQSRYGPIIIDSEIDNALDDHLNFHCSRGYLRKVASDNETDGYVYVTNQNFLTRPGDEIIFINQETKQVQNAFVKNYEQRSDGNYITVDRQITDLRPGSKSDNSVTLIFSNDSSCKSAIVRDSVFMNSRRNGMLVQAPNIMYEGNKIYNEGGSAVNVAGEIVERAGPYPNTFTFRNNYMKFDGEISGNGPVYIHVYENGSGDPALIENVLIENNTIDANPKTKHISVDSVNGLWLKNNTIICNQSVESTHKPVIISNSRIEEIDGIYIDYVSNIDAAVTITGSDTENAVIENIQFTSSGTGAKCVIDGQAID
ncbi:MAG: hypothetical protein ACI4DY_09110 [Monoglobaceae bacterium]